MLDEEANAAQSSPIDIMPAELLAQIFDHYALHDPFSPVLLSHVSSFWRRTAITTPRLWWSISARLPSDTPEVTSAKVRAWLARSGAFPLHISLIFAEWSDDEDVLSLLNDLREHGNHWGRFSLSASSYSIARRVFVFFTASPHNNMLSRIDLRTGTVSSDGFFEDDLFQLPDESEDARGDITIVFFAIHILAAYAPHLTELNLVSSALPYASWGATTRPELPSLRTLRIFERDGRLGQIEALSVLRILAKCPALEVFSFRGRDFWDPRSDPVDAVHLPRLRELHLAQTFHQRIILSNLSTPRLEVLYLSWLNRPDHLIDDSYEPEVEEDDAPVEFSQSPYTDILTGIGLRTLIRRCAPPLRVLDMDFADARSPKDFVWLFAHLPTLETFRIVGSDMSDRVLYALAERTWWGDKQKRFLCPRLTSLEFSRCDLITGRGIIALAKARNPAVGTEGDESEGEAEARAESESGSETKRVCARLTKFNVEACASVDCESVAVKAYLLGAVDFEVDVMPSWCIFPEEGIEMPE